MIHLRYQDKEWTYSKATLEIVTWQGDRVPLCTERNPRIGAFPVVRIGENEWRVAPSQFADGWFIRVPRDFLLLTGSTDAVNEDLSAL